jgi:hypothetical protein
MPTIGQLNRYKVKFTELNKEKQKLEQMNAELEEICCPTKQNKTKKKSCTHQELLSHTAARSATAIRPRNRGKGSKRLTTNGKELETKLVEESKQFQKHAKARIRDRSRNAEGRITAV